MLQVKGLRSLLILPIVSNTSVPQLPYAAIHSVPILICSVFDSRILFEKMVSLEISPGQLLRTGSVSQARSSCSGSVVRCLTKQLVSHSKVHASRLMHKTCFAYGLLTKFKLIDILLLLNVRRSFKIYRDMNYLRHIENPKSILTFK